MNSVHQGKVAYWVVESAMLLMGLIGCACCAAAHIRLARVSQIDLFGA